MNNYRGELEHIVYSHSEVIKDNSDTIQQILGITLEDDENVEITITGIIYHIYENNWFIENIMRDNERLVLSNDQMKSVYLYLYENYSSLINAIIDFLKDQIMYDLRAIIRR